MFGKEFDIKTSRLIDLIQIDSDKDYFKCAQVDDLVVSPRFKTIGKITDIHIFDSGIFIMCMFENRECMFSSSGAFYQGERRMLFYYKDGMALLERPGNEIKKMFFIIRSPVLGRYDKRYDNFLIKTKYLYDEYEKLYKFDSVASAESIIHELNCAYNNQEKIIIMINYNFSAAFTSKIIEAAKKINADYYVYDLDDSEDPGYTFLIEQKSEA